jgi:putative tricarboxylic transport membrane protein
MNYLQNRDRLGAFLLLIFSLFYLRSAFLIPVDAFDAELGFTSKTLPIGLAACAILVSTLLLFIPVSDRDSANLADVIRHYRWKPMLVLVLLMGVYAAVFSYVGFVVASVLFLQAAFFVLGERRFLISVSVSVGLVSFLWIFLTRVFGLYLDKGALLSAVLE